MVMEEQESSSSLWTREQDKAFENALAEHPEDCANRWEKIAADVPGKTIEDIKRHYELLVEDISGIESGRVPLPCYPSSSEVGDKGNEGGNGKKGGQNSHDDSGHGGKGSRSDQERRKGIAWTEDEHRLFLLGLEKYGKGDWRSISRNFVISRTPTQVASHAQKYFIRLNSMNKDRRRTSIHDITTVASGDSSAPQGPITGQVNASAAATGKSAKHPLQASAAPVGVSVLGTALGQPVVSPLFPAVGTPVNLPVPAASRMGYPVRPSVPATVVSGAPVSIPTPTYQMPPSSSSS
ncbi:transcription factor DIVARICATA [Canna indica]|uniref:Transcription factor MYBS1 n=1 Tax=Canna indica TaxID=4628 RepID=A0AAQ3JTT5_9LILI|nr:transcription factor DIVARICATA [Canna indica]